MIFDVDSKKIRLMLTKRACGTINGNIVRLTVK